MDPPQAQIAAITILADPRRSLGRYSRRIVTHWVKQAMKQPQRNRKITSHIKLGETVVSNPNTKSRAEDIIKDLRRP